MLKKNFWIYLLVILAVFCVIKLMMSPIFWFFMLFFFCCGSIFVALDVFKPSPSLRRLKKFMRDFLSNEQNLLGCLTALQTFSSIILFTLLPLYVCKLKNGESNIYEELRKMEALGELIGLFSKFFMGFLIDNTVDIFRLIGLPLALGLAARYILNANIISFGLLLISKLLEKMSTAMGSPLRDSLNLRYGWTDLSMLNRWRNAACICAAIFLVAAEKIKGGEAYMSFCLNFSLFCCCLTLILYVLTYKTRRSTILPPGKSIFKINIESFSLVLIIFIFIFLLNLKPSEFYLLAFLKQGEVSPTLVLGFHGLVNIFMLFQMQIFSWLCKEENKEIFLYVGPLALILTSVLFYFCSSNFWGVLAALFAWGTQRSISQLALTLLIKRHFPPALHGRMLSILSLTTNLASFISAFIFDTNATMFLTTIVINILSLIWVLLFRNDLTDTKK